MRTGEAERRSKRASMDGSYGRGAGTIYAAAVDLDTPKSIIYCSLAFGIAMKAERILEIELWLRPHVGRIWLATMKSCGEQGVPRELEVDELTETAPTWSQSMMMRSWRTRRSWT